MKWTQLSFGGPALWLALLCSCQVFGLSEEEEQRLTVHKQNAKKYYESGHLDRSIQQCRKGLLIDEDDSSLQLNLAFSLLRTGTPANIREAKTLLEDLDSWFDEDENHYKIQLGLGLAHMQIARLESKDAEAAAEHREIAQDSFLAALELAPDPMEVTFNLALLSLEQRNYEDFLSYSETTLRDLRKSFEVNTSYLPRIEQTTIRKQIEDDIATTSGRARELLQARSEIFFARKDYLQALENLNGLKKFSDLSSTDYYRRARTHELLGNKQQAIDDYVVFIRLSRDDGSSDLVQQSVEHLMNLRSQLADERLRPRGS